MNERDLKPTDLDYATTSHHMQMMKAAIPYMEIPMQRSLALFIKWNELMRTMDFFDQNDDGMMSVCSLDATHRTPTDMLSAVKAHATQREQEMIDLLSTVLSNRGGRSAKAPFSMDQVLSMMPPDQQSRFETLQMMMQTMGQM